MSHNNIYEVVSGFEKILTIFEILDPDKFDALLEIMITAKEEARRKATSSKATTKDLLDILMDAAEVKSAEVKLTRENIKAFVLVSWIIFTAGSDTTATSVEWMLAHLINDPACLDRLRRCARSWTPSSVGRGWWASTTSHAFPTCRPSSRRLVLGLDFGFL
ncbi:unnamed protein product [Urochloa humidicola]